MQTHDNELVGADPIQAEIAPVVSSGNYEAVRFNAMKHGILSKLTVLAHEDQTEFTDLLAALIEEHRPAGMTERHLVEELASIIWRKRRVLLAEGAAINRGLRSVAHSQHDSPIPAAAPFERGLLKEGCDLPDLLTASVEEIAERQRYATLDLASLPVGTATGWLMTVSVKPTMTARRGEPKRFGGGWAGRPVS